VLDDVLISSVFALTAAGVIAVAAVSLQPFVKGHSPSAGELATTAHAASGEDKSASDARDPVVVRLPTVVITAHRRQPTETAQLSTGVD